MFVLDNPVRAGKNSHSGSEFKGKIEGERGLSKDLREKVA